MAPSNSRLLSAVLVLVLVLVLVATTVPIEAADGDPIAHWVFDREHLEGSVVEPAGGDYRLKVSGEVRMDSATPESLVLDDETTRVSLAGDDAPLPAGAITIAAWIRVDRAGDWGGIVSAIQDNGDFEKGWLLGLSASRFTFGLSTRGADDGDGKITYVRAAARVRRQRWCHVAGTYDGVLQRLYVDGRLQGVDHAQRGEINYPRRVLFEVGAYRDDDERYPLAGRLREVRIYDRELGPDEIEALHAAAGYADLEARSDAARARETAIASTRRSDWPTYLGDRTRSGVTSAEVTPPLAELWRHRARRPPRPSWPAPARGSFWQRLETIEPRVVHDQAFHAVASSGRVYFGSSSEDQVFCLDGASGSGQWSFFTGGPIRFAPALANGRLYVGSDDGHVYCLDAESGALAWKYRAAPGDRQVVGNGRLISAWPIRTGVVVDDGKVFLTAGLFPMQGVYAACLNATSGSVLWRRQLEDASPQGYLLASSTRIYVPSGRAQPFALRRQDGRFLQSFKTAGGAYALLAGDSLVSGPGDRGTLDLSDATSSDRLATFEGRHLVVAGARSYLHGETELRALDRERFVRLGGERRALAELLGSVETILRAERGRPDVVAKLRPDRDRLAGELQRVSRELESCVPWKITCDHPFSLILAGETLFAGGRGEVGAYSAVDGRLLWTGKVDGDALGLAVSDGLLIVSTDTGHVHAFAPEAEARAAASREPAKSEPEGTRGEWSGAAKRILDRAAVERGFCLVLGASPVPLAAALSRQSELTCIVVDDDPGRVHAARKRLAAEGLYGDRVAVQTATDVLPFTDYFANLIVSEGLPSSGQRLVPASEVFRVLRPDGGVLWLETSDSAGTKALREWVAGSGIDGWTWRDDGRAVSLRRGVLPGSGEWTHQYAGPGNTASSDDALVGSSTRLQWFGGPGPRRMVDRHLRTVAPLYCAGRLFIPGNQLVIAVDAYNGTELWQVDVPGSMRLGAPYDASYLAASQDTLYVAAGGECWGLDARDGRRARTFRVPPGSGVAARHWGFVATVGDALFGSGQTPAASRRQMSREDVVEQYREFRPLVASESLFCFDRKSGEMRWHREAGLIVNNTLAVGGGRVYFVEGRPRPQDSSGENGRTTLEALFEGDTHLVALESRTGQVLWEQPFGHECFRHVLFLSYSEEILLASGSANEKRSTRYCLRAFSAVDGSAVWQADHPNNREGVGGDHGEQVHHPVITGNMVISEPWAFDLRTGSRLNPGGASAWSIPGRSGCGTLSASRSCLYFRDSHPSVIDLDSGGEVRKLTRASRPGCWISIIPAGGLVLLPEASSGCVCAYPLQTSMALLPLTRVSQLEGSLDSSSQGAR